MTDIKKGDTVTCVKEWYSAVFPDADYGKLGLTYTVLKVRSESGYLFLQGNGIVGEWVNAERFRK